MPFQCDIVALGQGMVGNKDFSERVALQRSGRGEAAMVITSSALQGVDKKILRPAAQNALAIARVFLGDKANRIFS